MSQSRYNRPAMLTPPSRFSSDPLTATPVPDVKTPLLQPATLGCRRGCGACCIAPSISSAIPGMPGGKPAGMRCIQLDDANGCRIFDDPRRPAVCASLAPSSEMCNSNRWQAMHYLQVLERLTA